MRACVVTASGKGQLKQIPMAKLKKYAKAYNIDVAGILEKDEFIEKLFAARVSPSVRPTYAQCLPTWPIAPRIQEFVPLRI